jgi:hypothetical protein
VNYGRALATLLKVPFKVELMLTKAVITPTEIIAAIKPYSIAVTPDSSLKNRNIACPSGVMGRNDGCC